MFRFHHILVLLAAMLISFVEASAATVLAVDLGDMAERSDRVVRARVLSKETRRDENVGLILTYVTLEVLENLSGEGPDELVLRQIGGELEGQSLRVEGDASFEEEEEVVVFVSSSQSSLHMVHLVGLALGKFRIEKIGGTDIAIRRLDGLKLVGHKRSSQQIEVMPEWSISLEELRERIGKVDPGASKRLKKGLNGGEEG